MLKSVRGHVVRYTVRRDGDGTRWQLWVTSPAGTRWRTWGWIADGYMAAQREALLQAGKIIDDSCGDLAASRAVEERLDDESR